MDKVSLIGTIVTTLIWMIPIIIAYNDGVSFAICMFGIMTTVIVLVLVVLAFYGTSGIKYIWEGNNLIEMWSRFMDALGCAKSCHNFPPQ